MLRKIILGFALLICAVVAQGQNPLFNSTRFVPSSLAQIGTVQNGHVYYSSADNKFYFRQAGVWIPLGLPLDSANFWHTRSDTELHGDLNVVNSGIGDLQIALNTGALLFNAAAGLQFGTAGTAAISASNDINLIASNAISLSSNLNIFNLDGTGINITLSGTDKFTANADYSANYNSLSYVSKGFTDASYWKLTGTSTVTTPIISGSGTFTGGTWSFTPTAAVAGLNIGLINGNPSTPTDGMAWLNTSTNGASLRVNGTTNLLLRTSAAANNRVVYYSGTAGGVQHNANLTFDGTGLVVGDATGTITASTTLDVRGISAGNILRLASASNNLKLLVLNTGYISQTPSDASGVSTPMYAIAGAFTPANGTNTFTDLDLASTISTTGTYSGIAYGINYHPTIGTTTGLTHIAWRNTSGGVLMGGTTITANTALDVRGLSTNIIRFATSSNSDALVINNSRLFTITGGNYSGVSTNHVSFAGADFQSMNNATIGNLINVAGSFANSSGSNINTGRSIHVATSVGYTGGASGNNYAAVSIAPTYNNTAGTSTVRDLYINPTNTSLTGTTHNAIETTSGDIVFAGIAQDDAQTRIIVENSSGKLFWRDVASITGSLTGTGSAGRMTYWTGTSTLSFGPYWDNTNTRLGIGEAVPQSNLHLSGSVPRINFFDNDAVISSSNPAWGIRASNITGSFNIQSTADYSAYTDHMIFLSTGIIQIADDIVLTKATPTITSANSINIEGSSTSITSSTTSVDIGANTSVNITANGGSIFLTPTGASTEVKVTAPGSGDAILSIERSVGTATNWNIYGPTGSADLRVSNGTDNFHFLSSGAVRFRQFAGGDPANIGNGMMWATDDANDHFKGTLQGSAYFFAMSDATLSDKLIPFWNSSGKLTAESGFEYNSSTNTFLASNVTVVGGDVTLGDSGLAGDRTISSSNSGSNSDLILTPQGEVYFGTKAGGNYVYVNHNVSGDQQIVSSDNLAIIPSSGFHLTYGGSGAVNHSFGGTPGSWGTMAGVIRIGNAGTAPTSSLVDATILYSEDVAASSELKVRDEAGNVTTLSPHNFSVIGKPSERMAWAHYSYREDDGKKYEVNVDELALAREVEKLVGKQLVYERVTDLKTGEQTMLPAFTGARIFHQDQGGFETTNNTIATAWTYTLPDNGTYVVRVTMNGKDATSGKSIQGVKQTAFERVTGTTSQVATSLVDIVTTLVSDAVNNAGAVWTIDNSGDSVRIRVTGNIARTIHWQYHVEVSQN